MGIAEKLSRKLFDVLYNPAIKAYKAKLEKEGLDPTFIGYTESPGTKVPFVFGQTDEEIALLNEGSLDGIMLVGKYRGLTRGEISASKINFGVISIEEDATALARFFISTGLRNLVCNEIGQRNRDELSKDTSPLKSIYQSCILYKGERLFERSDALSYSGRLFGPNLETESGWEEIQDASFTINSKDMSFISRVPCG